VSPFSIWYSDDAAEDLTAATAVERAVPIGESRERLPLLRERVQEHASAEEDWEKLRGVAPSHVTGSESLWRRMRRGTTCGGLGGPHRCRIFLERERGDVATAQNGEREREVGRRRQRREEAGLAS
jgi:hypothetical protein